MTAWLRLLYRLLWMLALCVLVLLALYASLGRQYIGLLGDYRQFIVDEIVQRSDVELELADLSGAWSGLAPLIEVSGLAIGGEGGIVIDRADIEFNLLSSLLLGRPQLNQIRVDELSLTLQQRTDGQWFVPGLASTGGDSPEWVVDTVLGIHNASLQRLTLQLHYADNTHSTLSLDDFSLDSDGEFRRAFAKVNTDEKGKITVLAEGYGDPRNTSDFHGVAYLNVDRSRFSALSPLFQRSAPIVDSQVDGQLWLTWRRQQRISLVGELHSPQLAVGALWGDESEQLSDVDMRFAGSYDDQDWHLSFSEFRATWRLQNLDIAGLSLRHPELNRWQFRLPRLELGPFTELLQKADALPAQSILKSLSPAGAMENLQFSLNRQSEGAPLFSLRTELHEVSVKPWHGAPGAKGITGYLELDATSGRLVIDSSSAELSFPRLYDKAFTLNQLQAAMRWQIADDVLQLRSGVITAEEEGAEAMAASLSLSIPLHSDSELDPEMTLSIGGRGVAASEHGRYTPRILNANLLSWLDRSIVDGRAKTASFLYRGSLDPDHPMRRNIQLHLEVENVELQYLNDWPAVLTPSANVYLDNINLVANADVASLKGGPEVSGLDVQIIENSAGHSELKIAATATPTFPEMKALLTETPLRQRIGSAFDDWRGKGSSAIQFALVQQLGGDHSAEINVAAEVDVAELEIPGPRLNLSGVNGKLRYRTSDGLQSEGLSARLFGRRVELLIAQEQDRVIIDAQGRVDIPSVSAWLQLPLESYLSGETDVKMRINAAAGEADLQLTSDLRGTELSLPQPLLKAADEAAELTIAFPLTTEFARDLTIKIANRGVLALRFIDGSFRGGNLFVGDGQARQPIVDQFRIEGGLPFAALSQWQMVLERYRQSRLQYDVPVAADAVKQPMLPVVVENFSVAEVEAFGQWFDDIVANARFSSEGSVLSLSGPELEGSVSITESAPMTLNIQRLFLSGLSESDSSAVTDLDPRQLPDLNLDIADLRLDGRQWGSIGFDLRSDSEGAHFSRLRGEIRGIEVDASSQESALHWLRGDRGDQTHLSGKFVVRDLGDVMERWSYQRVMETRSGEMLVDMRWPGSPDAWQLLESDGSFRFEFKEGRFLKSSDTASGALRLLSIFNMANIVRRLKFDFRDVFSSGIAFDTMRGDLLLQNGILRLAEPLEVKGPSSGFQMTGKIDMQSEVPDLRLVATLPVGSNLPWIAALVGGLPAAAGAYVVSKVFEEQVDSFSSAVYDISGTVQKPELTFKQIFDVDDGDLGSEWLPGGRRRPGGAR